MMPPPPMQQQQQQPGMMQPGAMPPPPMATRPPGPPGMAPPPIPGQQPPPPPPGGMMAPPQMPTQPGMAPPPPGGMMAPPPPGPPGMPMQPGMAPPPPGAGMAPPPPGPPSAQMQQMSAPPPPPGPQGLAGPPAFGTATAAAAAPPAMPGQIQGQAAQQQVLDQFESLSIGGPGSTSTMPPRPGAAPMTGPGSAPDGTGLDPATLPRPAPDPNPPLAAPVVLEGSCSPKVMRITCGAIPSSPNMVPRYGLPLGMVVQPLGDTGNGDVPVVTFGASGIVRCRRCRTYINPFAVFCDGGRRWRCNNCLLLNDVPVDYYCALDANGQRRDKFERPELCQGTVEYVATAEYMTRAPMPPAYVFVIDVSLSACSSGLVESASRSIRDAIDELAASGDGRVMVGILTYAADLHYYPLRGKSGTPTMCVVTDTADPFLPQPDDLLVNLSDNKELVMGLLDALPAMHGAGNTDAQPNQRDLQCAFGPAMQAAFLTASHVGGKVCTFVSNMPSVGAGKVTPRDQAGAYGTDKEHLPRCPGDSWYKKMAAEFSRTQMGVDLYCCPSHGASVDVASLSTLSRYTGGTLCHYASFRADVHGESLRHDIHHNLKRYTTWEGVMRIRSSRGLRISAFHGHFFVRSTDLLALPSCDADKGYAVQISHDEGALTNSQASFQCALLYTNNMGERRIRVHTLGVPVVSDMASMYKYADAAASMSLVARLCAEKALMGTLEECRQLASRRLVDCLREYRHMHAAQLRASNQLVFPSSLKFAPVMSLSLTKSEMLRGGMRDVDVERRCAALYAMSSLGVEDTMRMIYPPIYALHEPLPDSVETQGWPRTVPATAMCFDPRGIYLCDGALGHNLVIWVGSAAPPAAVQELCAQAGPDATSLAYLEGAATGTDTAKKVHGMVEAVRSRSRRRPPVLVVVQGTVAEASVMKGFWIEDRLLSEGTGNANAPPGSGASIGATYAEYLAQLYRQTMQKPASSAGGGH